MAKIRVYELAKSLNKDSKEIVELLKKNGVEVKNHMSSVTEEDAGKVRERFSAKSAAKAEPVVKAEPAAKAEPVKKSVAKPAADSAASGVQNVERAQASVRREGERVSRPQGERREPTGMRREEVPGGRPQGERREMGGMRRDGERGGRPQGERREMGGPRREGERGSRPQGDRRDFGGPRREGERGGRPQGDRRDFGGPRRDGERGGRPQGDRRDFGGGRGGRRDDRREEKLSIPAPMDRASIDRDRMDRHKDKKERDKSSLYEDGDNRKKSRKKDEHFTVKGTKPVKKPVAKPKPKEPEEPVIRTIELPETLTVQELADKVKTPVSQLIKKLFMAGEMVTVNTDLDFEKAAEIALEYNFIAEEEVKVDVIEEMLKEE